MTTHVGSLVVFGDIELKWLAFGGFAGPLGQPTSNEAPTFDGNGREQKFQGGLISWHPDAGVRAHIVWGLIGKRWLEIGREQFGYPVTDEHTLPDGGKYNIFRAMHIAGHPEATIVLQRGAGAAWQVYGAIRGLWVETGGTAGVLGYPTGEEAVASGGERSQRFEHGSIFWHGDGAYVKLDNPAPPPSSVSPGNPYLNPPSGNPADPFRPPRHPGDPF